jgi:hypothetical protein
MINQVSPFHPQGLLDTPHASIRTPRIGNEQQGKVCSSAPNGVSFVYLHIRSGGGCVPEMCLRFGERPLKLLKQVQGLHM